MIKNVISQIDVICIMPFWIGRNEISFTNLSFTVVFVLLIGVVFFVFLYGNQIIPRSFQVILENNFLNFSISGVFFGDGHFFKILTHVDVRRLKKGVNVKTLKKHSEVFCEVGDHPIIPNLVKSRDNNDFYLMVSNLTTKDRNAFFVANKDILHPSSNVYLYKDASIIKLENKTIANGVFSDLNLSETDEYMSNMFFFDNKLNDNINLLLRDQIDSHFGNNHDFFAFNSNSKNRFESLKNFLD